MKNFIKSFIEKHKIRNECRWIIRVTRSLIKSNWDSASTKYLSKFTTERKLEKTFHVGSLKFVVFRGFRGDLVEVFLNGELAVAYVDQSHQYEGLMGLNDIVIYVSKEEYKNAMQTINS